MTVRERQHVAVDRGAPLQHPVQPRSDLVGRLAARAAVAPQPPVGPSAGGSAASSGPRSRRSPTRAGRRRARPRRRSPASRQVSRARPSGLHSTISNDSPESLRADDLALLDAVLGQRQVGTARVLAGAAPLGLAVTHDEQAVGHSPFTEAHIRPSYARSPRPWRAGAHGAPRRRSGAEKRLDDLDHLSTPITRPPRQRTLTPSCSTPWCAV